MKSVKITLGIFLMSLLFLMSSCGLLVKSRAISTFTTENKAIPTDFGKEETILLCVVEGKRSYDKYLKKHVSNEYHGKYEFILRKDLDSDKFKDTSQYRYVFDYDRGSSFTGGIAATNASYFIFDRKEDVKYISPLTSSFFSRLIQGYMINLEKERLKNI
ncbi:hypothetical protein [Xanthovirga aplysinae]|uniref:hypothetical protein n=1 Tax=Xanthovirga aplysinae TaxID=2529853 RepID=UPI0012BBF538|nr:hypothetical protein [Xanthovirga aplysinae]MTI31418.1 hypothetical protein [Xanthovirga aplysinae]